MSGNGPEDQVRQLLVHPKVWPHLVRWLDEHGIAVIPHQFREDDVPTYVMSMATADEQSPDKTTGDRSWPDVMRELELLTAFRKLRAESPDSMDDSEVWKLLDGIRGDHGKSS